MKIKLYNSLSRAKEEFKPIKKGQVGVYACGPTVYHDVHVGNLRTFIFADVLRRFFDYQGLEVKFVMNITDVGHLTDDADNGEDKMLVAMQREGKTAYDIAAFYTEKFLKDSNLLNIIPATAYPRATQNISEQIIMIKKLEEKGFTYQTSDGVYFDTSKLDQYGRFGGQKAEEKQAGARVEMGEKKSVTDFALWKLSPTDQQREMEWDSPWGKGFPGWHLECSVMSAKELGVPFDVHLGGSDLAPIHHENEIAQTMGAEGVLQANYWLHGAFLNVDGGKMSKTQGNFYTLQDIIDKGFHPLAFRYFVLGAHYRSTLNFTWEALEAAQNALFRLWDTVRDWDLGTAEGSNKFEISFESALTDDLNTPEALAIMWGLVDSSLDLTEKAQTLLKFDRVFGLDLEKFVGIPLEIPSKIKALVDKREKVRQVEDWVASDELRDEIAKAGFVVEDTDTGTKVREKRK